MDFEGRRPDAVGAQGPCPGDGAPGDGKAVDVDGLAELDREQRQAAAAQRRVEVGHLARRELPAIKARLLGRLALEREGEAADEHAGIIGPAGGNRGKAARPEAPKKRLRVLPVSHKTRLSGGLEQPLDQLLESLPGGLRSGASNRIARVHSDGQYRPVDVKNKDHSLQCRRYDEPQAGRQPTFEDGEPLGPLSLGKTEDGAGLIVLICFAVLLAGWVLARDSSHGQRVQSVVYGPGAINPGSATTP